jgi:signal transduction histidine kinase
MSQPGERYREEPWALVQNAYLPTLIAYLDGGGESALERAYEIGRAALGAGVGVVELGRIHHAALEQVLAGRSSPDDVTRTLQAAAGFFAETTSPFEMAYRGFHEASLALRHFNDLLEQETKRIAHALHDEAGQLLVAVYIALAEMSWDHPNAEPHILKIRELLDKIEEQLRRLSHELRPAILDDLGLVPAVRYLSEGISQRTGLVVTVESSQEDRWSAPTEAALYRAVQEALNNITRHARATHAWISLECQSQSIRCAVRDDGIGFDVEAVDARQGEQGFGLIGIRERVGILGGHLEVRSVRGRGTELVVTMPVEN